MNIDVGTLPEIASAIVADLHAAGFESNGDRQVLCLAEEVGEFVGAYRRWSGRARRMGSFDDVRAELADVVFCAFVVAEELDIDLQVAMEAKMRVMHDRGWKERQ